MPDDWKSYPNAPVHRTEICKLSDINNPGTMTIDLDCFPLLLVRQGEQLYAYVNACPHQYLPLDYKGNRLLSSDGKKLRCTNHSASFAIETGEGIEGFGIGCNLDIVPIGLTENNCVFINISD